MLKSVQKYSVLQKVIDRCERVVLDVLGANNIQEANIAVESPEAPLDSTLYRTLFLSAVLLFTITFLLNSAAEWVRQWLRGKYGRY